MKVWTAVNGRDTESMGDGRRGSQQARAPQLEALVNDYLERHRRGEAPPVDEFVQAHASLGEELHAVLPALLLLEDAGERVRAREAPADTPGRLGDYRIVREIGRGGMGGVVYEAVQESLGRHVALKVLSSHSLPDGTQLKRFRQEARAAGRLHHANIVPVFGIGEDEGILFYAMQYIDGEGLDEVLDEIRERKAERTPGRRPDPETIEIEETGSTGSSIAESLLEGDYGVGPGPSRVVAAGGAGAEASKTTSLPVGPSTRPVDVLRRPVRRTYYGCVAHLGVQVADALAYAHSRGILHRDIKPSNLILDGHGTVWVTDFGLAKLEGSAKLTLTGDVVGTLRYVAPEGLEGKANEQSDVYSLGLTLYEALTQRPAFDDTSRRRLVRRILEETPRWPRRIDPRVPRDLETVVLTAIEKDPRDRYTSANALAEDLRRFLSGLPLHVRPAGSTERLWRWVRRKPIMAGLTAAVFLLAIVSTLMAVKLWNERNVAREHLWSASLAQARANRTAEQQGRRLDSLEALARAAAIRPTAELRDEALAALALFDLRPEEQCPVPEGSRRFLCAPRFHLCAVTAAENPKRPDQNGVREIQILETPAGQTLQRIRAGGADIHLLSFGPKGDRLAYRQLHRDGSATAGIIDLETGELVLETATKPHGMSLEFHGNGTVAIAQGHGSVGLYTLNPPREWKRLDVGPVDHFALDPPGARLAISRGKEVVIVDLATGRVTRRLSHLQRVMSVAWHPSEDLLAVGCFDKRVYVWEPRASSEPRLVLRGHHGQVTNVTFACDGEILVSRGWDGRMLFWNAWSGRLCITREAPFTGDVGDDRVWSRHDGVGRIWRLDLPAGFRRFHALAPESSRPYPCAFSNGGQLIATGGPEGVCIWKAASGRLAGLLPARKTVGLAFASDGALVTASAAGIHRWALQHNTSPGRTAGPSRAIWSNRRAFDLAIDRNGRRLAFTDERKAYVVDLEALSSLRTVPGDFARGRNHVALSSDGRWLASFGWHDEGVRIRDLEERRTDAEIPGYSPKVTFSPDDRWLVVSTRERCRLFELGKWRQPALSVDVETDPHKAPHVAFSPRGQVLALADPPGRVRFLESASGREIARLRPPGRPRVGHLAFSPRGDTLLASVNAGEILAWDLPALGRQLAEIGLDWSLPLPTSKPEDSGEFTERVPAGSKPQEQAASPEAVAELQRPFNQLFAGSAGSVDPSLHGTVPDGWKIFGEETTGLEAKIEAVPAGALHPSSPPANAVVLRLDNSGHHGLTGDPRPFPLTPGRDYRVSFYVRSENKDGSDQPFQLHVELFRSREPEKRVRRLGTRDSPQALTATSRWRKVSRPVFRNQEAASGIVSWSLVEDGGENAIAIALPRVKELLYPTELEVSANGDTVQLEWKNHALHESARILRDGETIASLAPEATSFTDDDVPPGKHTYQLEAVILRRPRLTAAQAVVEDPSLEE